MHGRVKLRTSEEDKLRKEKERQEKLLIFQHAMKKVLIKCKEGQLDKELLDITGQVLSANPDIYTLWNLRRDVLNIFKKADENAAELSKTFDSELSLTEYCLKINPKSYCAWYQREWVLLTRADPDWKKELMLCNKYLSLDERNFHTWDYRRFVVLQYNPPLEDEFKYTTEKLLENFSNYSAWHYRSKMLVELYPDLDAGRPIEDSHHKHELEMVLNAAFTDPDDTSAWFYQRWLLGAVKETIQLVVCTVNTNKTTVAFSKHVPKHLVELKTKLYLDDNLVTGQWMSCTGNLYDNLWIYVTEPLSTDATTVKFVFECANSEEQILECIKQKPGTYVGKSKINFQKQYSKPVIDELEKQLNSCRQLLDFEPRSKWTLLTTTVLLHCINFEKYHEETIDKLKTLKEVDAQRAGYYDDLIAKWSIENMISTSNYEENYDFRFQMMLSEKITSLPHSQYYSNCETVDLSNNHLTSRVLPSLIVFQHCKVLSLENNKLTTLKGFPNLCLQELNLKGNELLDKAELNLFIQENKFHIIY